MSLSRIEKMVQSEEKSNRFISEKIWEFFLLRLANIFFKMASLQSKEHEQQGKKERRANFRQWKKQKKREEIPEINKKEIVDRIKKKRNRSPKKINKQKQKKNSVKPGGVSKNGDRPPKTKKKRNKKKKHERNDRHRVVQHGVVRDKSNGKKNKKESKSTTSTDWTESPNETRYTVKTR